MEPTKAERRHFQRLQTAYQVTLTDETGLELLTKTINLSDGGALILVPFSGAPDVGQEIKIKIAVPVMIAGNQAERTATCSGIVVRHQDLGLTSQIGLAVEFSKPLNLDMFK